MVVSAGREGFGALPGSAIMVAATREVNG